MPDKIVAKCPKCGMKHYFDEPTHVADYGEDGPKYLQVVFICCGKKRTASRKVEG